MWRSVSRTGPRLSAASVSASASVYVRALGALRSPLASLSTSSPLSVLRLRPSQQGSSVERGQMGQTRRMSSLGSPMFPQQSRMELKELERRSRQQGPQDPEQKPSILEGHGGKIAIAAFAAIIALLWSYYATGKDRSKIESDVENGVFLDPYEIQQLRLLNQLQPQQFFEIASRARAQFPGDKASYGQFVVFLKEVRLTGKGGEGEREDQEMQGRGSGASSGGGSGSVGGGGVRLQLQSAHLLDRLAMGIVQSMSGGGEVTGSSSGSAGAEAWAAAGAGKAAAAGTAGTEVGAWSEVPLELPLLLTVLSLTLRPDAQERSDVFFQMARLFYPAAGTGASMGAGRGMGMEAGVEEGDGAAEAAVGEGQAWVVDTGAVEGMLLQLLRTDQVPPVKQVTETGVKYPVKLHRRKTAAEMITDAEAKRIKNQGSNAPPRQQPVGLYDAELFSALLRSSTVCAWGECYKSNRN